jgi:uncharacterized protein (DUF58 family)
LREPVLLDHADARERNAIELQFPHEAIVTDDIPAQQWLEIRLPLKTSRRGRHALPRITVSSTFPLGLFRVWSHVRLQQDYLVYPQPSDDRGLPPEAHSQALPLGDQGRGTDDFAGLRNYQSGDSLRQIHWKLAAREQGLITKRFGGDQHPDLWLDWEQTPGANAETRLSRLTRWVLEADAQSRRYGLRLPGVRFEPDSGETQRRRCLEALALHGLPPS